MTRRWSASLQVACCLFVTVVYQSVCLGHAQRRCGKQRSHTCCRPLPRWFYLANTDLQERLKCAEAEASCRCVALCRMSAYCCTAVVRPMLPHAATAASTYLADHMGFAHALQRRSSKTSPAAAQRGTPGNTGVAWYQVPTTVVSSQSATSRLRNPPSAPCGATCTAAWQTALRPWRS